MSIFKCKMCGGNLEVTSDTSVVTCEYCGTYQTISKSRDEVVSNLYNRANDLRIKCEFDRAEQTYGCPHGGGSGHASGYRGVGRDSGDRD